MSEKPEETQAPETTEAPKDTRLESYASAHRMLLYLLMALVVLELADIPAWATIPVFILYLWSDHGSTVVALQDAGWSNLKITLRLFVDVLPVVLVALLAWVWEPTQIAVGVAALAALAFYLVNRHRISKTAAGLVD